MFVNYAHRGASEYAPENTFSSFYLGLLQGANGIETDVRLTADNVAVLFHDETVDRVTDGSGLLSSFTFEELTNLNVHRKNCAITDKVPTFEDFLKHFAYRNITFAIEIKQAGADEKVTEMLEKYGMVEKTVVTAFEYEYLKNVHDINKGIKLGYLVNEASDKEIERLKKINGYQMCPNAGKLSVDKVRQLRNEGFSIRAWGVSNELLMEETYSYNIDGMTVNFPDKLAKLIEKTNKYSNLTLH